jgi:acetylornithine deacetylase/succinyl-diaminopimelate desuccinylase-like protein
MRYTPIFGAARLREAARRVIEKNRHRRYRGDAHPASDALAARAQAIYAELGKASNLEGTGAAADSSLAAGVGVPVLDGFGIVGGGAHSPDEYIEIDSWCPVSI